MKYEFSNKKELEQLLTILEGKLTSGLLMINEPLQKQDIITTAYELPDEVVKFFNDNSVKTYKLLNDLPVPFFIKDSNCRWFYVNKAFCSFFEVNLADIYKKTSHALFSKKKAELFYDQDCRLMETGKTSTVEAEIVNATGHSRTVLTNKALFHDINNTPYIIGIFYEVTGFKDVESSIKQEKTELETQVKARTSLLSATIEKLQDEIGQRSKTEQALIQEEDKFRGVIEQAVEGIALNDNLGRIIEWNDALVKITGIAKEKAIGKYIWDVEFMLMDAKKRNQDFYNFLKETSLKTMNAGEIPKKFRVIEGKILREDGEIRVINFTSFPIKTQNAFYTGRIVRDITEQRKSVIAIQRSEAQYRTIFENSSIAIFIINPESHIIMTANNRATEIYGYTTENLTGMPMQQIAKDYSFDRHQMGLIINHQIAGSFETIHLDNKGTEINIIVNGSPIEYGGITAFMSFNRNVTELKRLEKARETVYKISQLAHTETTMEDLYRSIHKIINEIIPARNFYIALYDEASDIVSFPYHVDEKDPTPESRRLRRGLTEYVLRHGEPILTNPTLLEQLEVSGEIEVIGSYSDVWLGVPLKTHNKVIGVVAVQSYSGKINYTVNEKDLLVYVSEQIANQIYKRRAEEEIIRGKQKAEESDRLKTSLIANMNHDLRTPMTGILGFASLLKNKVTDPNLVSMVDTIIESGDKLMATINSILQLSQLEASQKQIDIISGDLSKFAEMSLNLFAKKAQQKNLYIVKEYSDSVFGTFNENYLIQIVNNLITNAITYTEKGGITVRTGHTNYQDKDYVYLSVEDTGIGISESNFNLIFQEFRQVSEGLNRKYDGSGLGLSLCKKMAEIMGGKILVESSIGIGSVFTILMPPSTQHNHKKTEQNGKDSFKLEHSKKNKHKVLVVDDNKINGELLNAILKQDYEVDVAKTGHLAIELVKRSDYDIILMDINLGEGMTGIQAAREIQKIKVNIPIIAMTAYSTEKEINEIMKNYFFGFVLKPIDKIALFKVLEKSIGKKNKPG